MDYHKTRVMRARSPQGSAAGEALLEAVTAAGCISFLPSLHDAIALRAGLQRLETEFWNQCDIDLLHNLFNFDLSHAFDLLAPGLYHKVKDLRSVRSWLLEKDANRAYQAASDAKREVGQQLWHATMRASIAQEKCALWAVASGGVSLSYAFADFRTAGAVLGELAAREAVLARVPNGGLNPFLVAVEGMDEAAKRAADHRASLLPVRDFHDNFVRHAAHWHAVAVVARSDGTLSLSFPLFPCFSLFFA